MMKQNELKKTQVNWLPEIPKHWDLIKVRYLFKESSIKGFPNEKLLVASQEHGVVSKDVFGKRTMEATKDFHLLKLVEEGDFVISLRSFQGGIEYTYERGIISPAYTILKEQKPINKRYFKHLFKSSPFISLMKSCVKGIRDGQNIDFPTFKGEYLPLPSINEQEAIGAYLDKKTAQIQDFIHKKERLINLAKGKSYSLVVGNEYRTDENGFWENIPKHWKVEKAKWIFDEVNIRNCPKEELLAVTQDRGVLPKSQCEENFVSPNDYEGLKLVDKNDFVISLRSFQGGIEYSLHRGIVSPAYTIIRLKKKYNSFLYREYFKYLFKSKQFIILLNTAITGIRDGKNVNWSDFRFLKIPIPPSRDIESIVPTFNEYESLVEVFKNEKLKLQEYQESLIANVITGKLKVPAIYKQTVMN